MKQIFRGVFSIVCICALLLTSASALSVEEALDILEEDYVYDLPPAAYEANTLEELFSILGDPYTYYMTAEEYEAFLSSVEGDTSVTGIGAGISYGENGILITQILPGGGAEEVGLHAGDLIIAVDGVSCVPADESHRAQIIGEEGTYVTVTVKRENGTVRDFRIQRRTVEILNTTVTVKDGVGYIDCSSFGSQTGVYFVDGINKYDDQVHLWVVDLRSNGGGVAGSAVKALGTFVGAGPLLYFRDRSGAFSYNFSFDDYITEHPVIVLTNGYTASASEIFVGGIRAGGAGISVGSRTFGKGVAQIVRDETAGDEFSGDALKVTAYRFYLIDGNTTDRIGVIPTVCVSDDMTDAIIALLSGTKPRNGSEYLHLALCGYDFYINLPPDENEDALRALLAALAPDTPVYYGTHGREMPATVSEAYTLCFGETVEFGFTDVAESRFADKINALGTYRLVLGDGSGAFHPSDQMTRAEVCCLLAQALDLTTTTGGYFSDVPDRKWYAGSINAMAALGLVNGVGGGRFDPNGTMTQEQFFTVMGRLAAFLNCGFDLYLEELDEAQLAADSTLAPFAPWARGSVNALSASLVTPDQTPANMLFDDVSHLSPQAPILREEAAATMYNTLTILGVLRY